MAYTPATSLPSLTFFQWSRPSAPNPRLAAPIEAATTTLTFTSAPLDRSGAVIDGGFLMGVKNNSSYTELIYVPVGEMSVDGLTATNVIRGVRISGTDYTTGDSSYAAVHEQDSPVFCAVSAVYESILQSWVQGGVASGGAGLTIGTDSGGTTTIYRATGAGTKQGVYRWDAGTGKAQFSNDGTNWVDQDSVAASNLVAVSAADTTPGYLSTKGVAGDGLDESITSPAGDERWQLDVDVTDFIDTSYGLTEDTNNIRINLDATPGLEFNAGALRAKIKTNGGITRDSDGLSLTQAFNPTLSFVAAETITADDAVAILPYQVEWFTQLTDANIALGDSNVRRKYYVKYIPKANESFTTTSFRAAEASAGATALGNLIVSWQTETAGAPSGTAVSNGSVTISQATQRTWGATMGSRTATHAGAVALTKGTTYYLVFECSATDAANYLNFSVNSSHDENYCTFTRGTYNLDTLTWGSTVTNATPFFWVNTISGIGLVQADASWGARTWNFIGFAKAGGAADASIDVYYSTVPDLANLTPNSDYWLSETAGAITTTAPDSIYTEATEPTAFAYKIGRAISPTSLKVERGQKRVLIRETSGLTATTTRQYVIWFKPERVKVDAAQDNEGGSDAAVSAGYVTSGASNFSVGMMNINAGSSDTATSNTASIVGSGLSDYFTCVGSDLTNAGFTYTYTETADPAGLVAVLEAVA